MLVVLSPISIHSYFCLLCGNGLAQCLKIFQKFFRPNVHILAQNSAIPCNDVIACLKCFLKKSDLPTSYYLHMFRISRFEKITSILLAGALQVLKDWEILTQSKVSLGDCQQANANQCKNICILTYQTKFLMLPMNIFESQFQKSLFVF